LSKDVNKGFWNSWLLIILATSLTGGLVKTIGGLIYGSKALFVDALTCIANFISLIVIIRYYSLSLQPPDIEHPYGHHRFGVIGANITLITYGYVAGIATVELIYSTEYVVHIESFYYALLGFILYSVAIILSFKLGGFFKIYGLFTVSELYESLTTIVSSLAGATISYLIDYAGAVLLTLYILYELYESGRNVFKYIVDVSAPQTLLEDVKNTIIESGYVVESIRIRCIVPNVYHGDIVVKSKSPNAIEISDLKDLLKRKYNLDASIEVVQAACQ